jgi:hypothetical protein
MITPENARPVPNSTRAPARAVKLLAEVGDLLDRR